MNSYSPSIRRIGFWGLVLLPIVVYGYWLATYAVNIPLFDDHAFKNFLLKWNENLSFFERIRLIFSQHNEHRVAFTRLIILTIYGLTGQLNYVAMMWVGNLLVLGIYVLLVRMVVSVAATTNRKSFDWTNTWLALPIAFGLFTLQFHENTFWGMASLQNFGVVFWAILTFYAIARQNFWLGVLLGFCATFTSGNGFLVLGIVGLYLLSVRDYSKFIVWLGFTSVLLVLYFVGYQRPPGNPTEVNLHQFGLFLQGLAVLSGAFFDVMIHSPLQQRINLAMLGGVAILSLTAIVLGRYVVNWIRHQKLTWGESMAVMTVLFVLGTAALTVWGRLGFGMGLLLTSRYKIYSVVLTLTVVASLLLISQRLRTIWWQGSLVLISVMYWSIVNFEQLEEVIFHRKFMIASQWNGQYEPSVKGVPYKAPSISLDSKWNLVSTHSVKIDSVYRVNNQFVVLNKSLPFDETQSEGIYIALVNNAKQYVIPCRQNRNRSKKNLLKGGAYFSNGFVAEINESDWPKGIYHLKVLAVDPHQVKVYDTPQAIEIVNGKSADLQKNW
ncbi:MAG: hypothetical protein U0Y10_17430 [Spirosomataceae bacterium]